MSFPTLVVYTYPWILFSRILSGYCRPFYDSHHKKLVGSLPKYNSVFLACLIPSLSPFVPLHSAIIYNLIHRTVGAYSQTAFVASKVWPIVIINASGARSI